MSRTRPVSAGVPATDHRAGTSRPQGPRTVPSRLGTQEAFEFVSEYQAHYPVATMCRLLEVSTSGYCAGRRRPLSPRAREDARLRARIETFRTESHGTYGSPRVNAELAETEVRIGRRGAAPTSSHFTTTASTQTPSA